MALKMDDPLPHGMALQIMKTTWRGEAMTRAIQYQVGQMETHAETLHTCSLPFECAAAPDCWRQSVAVGIHEFFS